MSLSFFSLSLSKRACTVLTFCFSFNIRITKNRAKIFFIKVIFMQFHIINPFFLNLLQFFIPNSQNLFNPLWTLLLKNSKQEFFMFLQCRKLINIFIIITNNILNLGIQSLNLCLTLFPFLSGQFGLLNTITSGFIIILNEFN